MIPRPPRAGLPAGKGARVVATRLLDAAVRAATKLLDDGGADALHDFRVALRRLNVWLKTYRPVLGKAATKKLRHRLRDVARATGAARDADVQLVLLKRWCETRELQGTDRCTRVIKELERDRSRARKRCLKRVARAFPVGAMNLARQLERRPSGVEVSDTFGVFSADVLERGAARLSGVLAACTSGLVQAHAARLAAKDQRYVLEAFQAMAGAKRLLNPLKDLQDALGELHDVEMLVSCLGQSAARHLSICDRATVRRHFLRRTEALARAAKGPSAEVKGARARRDLRSFCAGLRG